MRWRDYPRYLPRFTAACMLAAAASLLLLAQLTPLYAGSSGANRSWVSPTLSGTVTMSTDPVLSAQALTAGTMTVSVAATSKLCVSEYAWTNAMVSALGGVTTGNVAICTLPAKTVVRNAYLIITGQGAGVTTLTVSVGRVAAGYTDYLKAGDAKAAANTIYGPATGDRGTGLTGYDLPNIGSTAQVFAQFVSTGANLSAVTGSTGVIYLETEILP